MKTAGKSWDDIRSALNLTRAGIKKWRDGDFKDITAANVFALADLLGCNARWMALGEPPDEDPGLGQVLSAWAHLNEAGRVELASYSQFIANQPRFQSVFSPPISTVFRK